MLSRTSVGNQFETSRRVLLDAVTEPNTTRRSSGGGSPLRVVKTPQNGIAAIAQDGTLPTEVGCEVWSPVNNVMTASGQTIQVVNTFSTGIGGDIFCIVGKINGLWMVVAEDCPAPVLIEDCTTTQNPIPTAPAELEFLSLGPITAVGIFELNWNLLAEHTVGQNEEVAGEIRIYEDDTVTGLNLLQTRPYGIGRTSGTSTVALNQFINIDNRDNSLTGDTLRFRITNTGDGTANLLVDSCVSLYGPK